MSEIDAGEHATPDQLRAAQKRAQAAAAARGESTADEAREAAPKGRSSRKPGTETA